MIVGTKYDKELKEKVFYVREVDSYTHKTTTNLTVDWVDGVFTLTAVVSNLIGKGFVKFYRDGVEVGEQYVSKTATLLLQSETNTGVFVAKFMGNSDCLKSQSSEVSYSPLPVPEFSLTVDKDTGVVGDTLTFTPHLSDGVTGSIVYTVDGAEYTKNVGETFTYKFNKTGSFIISAVYSGDETHQGATASVLVTISKINLVFTGSASSTNVYVGETVTISGTLKTSAGSPLGNVKIIDGAGQVKAITGATGVWSFTSVEDTVGTSGWSLYPDLDWDKYNTPKNVDIQITIRKKDTVLTCTVDKTSVTVGENVLCTLYLKDNQNNPLANKTVYCNDWSKTTNDEGRVMFNYANPHIGEVTKVFKFDGDNLYNGASVTAKWTVVPAESPQISISASTLIGEVGDDLPITLSSNLKNTALTVLLNDAEVADSVTTDNTGNASFNYTCTGAGDVNVKVKYLSGTNVYYSNILQVEDCIKYGFKDSDTWINPTGHSATNTVVDGVFTSTSNSSKGDSILQLDLTGDFIITYDAQWQASTRCGVGAEDTTRTQHFDSGTDSNGANQKYVSYNGSNETDTIYKNSNIAEYVNCKIIKHNNTLTGYMNNTEVVSVDYGWISTCTVWNFHTTIWNSDKTLKIKNLKIKPQ
nr:Ig-like domain-containing protein [Methanobrevibacter smithii]